MCMESARIDQVGRQLVDGANANETRVHLQFILNGNQKPAPSEKPSQ